MKFTEKFGKIPIFGMIHLAGDLPVVRALEEIDIYEEEGVTGVIIENYHGDNVDVLKTLQSLEKRKIEIGVNILPNEYDKSFVFASKFGGSFIQMDYVAGDYGYSSLKEEEYKEFRNLYKDIIVLGGVWPKYYTPVKYSNLQKDLYEAINRCDAVVVTGQGTGKETPIEKIKKFREILFISICSRHQIHDKDCDLCKSGTNFPLIVGAGLTVDNAYEQLSIADGAIVGTAMKLNNDTTNKVDRVRVKELMSVVKSIRK
jgi:predicted TIM-barrel enzyme